MTGVVQDIDWQAIAPPLVLACTAVVVLLADAFAGPPRTRGQALVLLAGRGCRSGPAVKQARSAQFGDAGQVLGRLQPEMVKEAFGHDKGDRSAGGHSATTEADPVEFQQHVNGAATDGDAADLLDLGPGHRLAVDSVNVTGAVSIIVWTLAIIIAFKYVWLVLRADNDGEGGILEVTRVSTSRLGTRMLEPTSSYA